MAYYLIIGCFIFFLLFSRFFIVVVLIIGNSMLPTFNEHDRVLALRFWPAYMLKKGDIVVVSGPADERLFVKRVTALPGETFRAIVRTGRVGDQFVDEEKVWEIPQNHFFVCGDNPDSSYDSRYFGPLKASSLYAIVIYHISRNNQ